MPTPRINTKLLTSSDSRNLKIYPGGFEFKEFMEIARIIKSHGGIITSPDEETLILSKLETPPDNEFLRFNIQWLYDSIRKNQLQDIGPYLLPAAARGQNKNSSVKKTIKKPEVITLEDDSDVQTKKRKMNSEAEKVFKVESPEPTHQSKDDEEVSDDSLGYSFDTRPSPSKNLRNKKGLKKMSASPEVIRRTSGRLRKIALNEKPATPPQNHKNTVTPSPKKKEKPKSSARKPIKKTPYTAEDNLKILNYIIDNSAFDKTNDLQFWKDCVEEFFPERTPPALMQHFNKSLVDKVGDYIQDPDIVDEFEGFRI